MFYPVGFHIEDIVAVAQDNAVERCGLLDSEVEIDCIRRNVVDKVHTWIELIGQCRYNDTLENLAVCICKHRPNQRCSRNSRESDFLIAGHLDTASGIIAISGIGIGNTWLSRHDLITLA